ncbi:MAG: class II aldolase/adducin family protein [candidate division WOR-3 bacterium]|nr:class II aldolase/adducin family protein [candidate division WOR-3 bacterium]MCX7836756.1 class II aldolase/adducin family protein [candidate division WOR-3 bacterium]MDW8114389.1 class II aldolase/adducin family protein [candidate division WOR-3 bacterium]
MKVKVNNIKKEIKKIFHYLYLKDLITASDGNISYKINESKIVINKTNVFKGEIKEKDLILVNFKKRIPKEVSKELKLHLNLYEINKDIKAIIHSHPIYPLLIINQELSKEFYIGTGLKEEDISFISYYEPGSEELAQKVKENGRNKKVIILENHGVIVLGRSLKEAFFLTEKVNFWAKYQYYNKTSSQRV